MKTAWLVTAYVRSDMPLNSDTVLPMMSIDLVFFTEEPPTRQMISDIVDAHTRNCGLLSAEICESRIPRELLP